jgi:hypothetical protein
MDGVGGAYPSVRARACVVARSPTAVLQRASPAMAPKMRLHEQYAATLIASIQVALGEPRSGRSDVARLATIFVLLGLLIMEPDPAMIAELSQVFLGASSGTGYYRFIAECIENIMVDPHLTSNMDKISTLVGFVFGFAEVVRLPWPSSRTTQATPAAFEQDVRNLTALMKINLWTLRHGSPPALGDETEQAMETDYVFFTATMQAADMEAALGAIQQAAAEARAEPAATGPPAGGEPDVEPESRYDTLMQRFQRFCPEWTDQEIADHIELMDVDPFIDDVQLFLESMD